MKYDQHVIKRKVDTNTTHIITSNKDINDHKDTLNHLKAIIQELGIDINELNSISKQKDVIFPGNPSPVSGSQFGNDSDNDYC